MLTAGDGSTTSKSPLVLESASNSPMKLQSEKSDCTTEMAAQADHEALDESGEICHVEATDEASVLKNLTEGVRDQEELQRDISNQANLALIQQEDDRDEKRIDRVHSNREKLLSQRRSHKRRLDTIAHNRLQQQRLQNEIDRIDSDLATLDSDIQDIQRRIEDRHKHDDDNRNIRNEHVSGNKRLSNESQRDFLIRTGKITPFSRMPARNSEEINGSLTEVLMDAEEEAEEANQPQDNLLEPKSHQHLKRPGFLEISDSGSSTPVESEFSLRPRKKRRVEHGSGSASGTWVNDISGSPSGNPSTDSDSAAAFTTEQTDSEDLIGAYDDDDDNDVDGDGIIDVERRISKKSSRRLKLKEDLEDLTGIDDGNEEVYQSRLRSWVERRSRARQSKQQNSVDGDEDERVGDLPQVIESEEWFKLSPDAPDHQYENGLKLPGDIYSSLFDYQKTGVQWLGELYEQQVGGIVGDEMGLGKTIQIIAFLAGLHYSKKLSKPVIVVAPATVLRQWVNEFHTWWPPLRVSILHTSGSGMLNVRNEGRKEDEEEIYYRRKDKTPSKSQKSAKRIVDKVVDNGHVLVTTYAGLQTYGDILIPIKWGYAVLDEGHKIRNPNTAITVYCKELQTANRVILSGTPMQNNLIELWSLFDFVYPMRLGTLVNFRNQFEVPIKIGGYANATNLQILTATKCAETLKEAISPYLLQRVKADVAADLPKKSEQVLFCKLTKPQREAYEMFLSSEEMTSILNRTRQSLYGIDILRKICNHPDLLDPRLRNKPGYKWGNPNKSGKMQVVKALLEIWQKAGDKTLLFSQGVQMLNIIEDYVKSLEGFNYLRMDGGTNIKDRQSMVDRFNNDPGIHVFLLTTKVGGLGVNLTGANRVIIFDPDWNPSTDVQARERAWRLGQKKEVTIYRLMTAGTIEEKIYHRQIFKQFLADKILKDPKQRQTFHMKDLHDLFTLGSMEDGTTETGQMFKGTEVQFQKQNQSMNQSDPKEKKSRSSAVRPESSMTRNDDVSYNRAQPTVIQNLESTANDEEQVRKIVGVAGLEVFRGDPSEENPSSEESRILEGIFARSGVHSVLEHDQIVNGKRVIAADRNMIEREAKKVAADAAAELRKAGEAAKHVPIGTVTWTGEVGEAGRPENIRRGGGPSSASILSNLSNRQGLMSGSGSASNSRSGTPGSSERSPRGKDFLKLIRDYISRQGGSVPSQMLVVHFGGMCRTAQQSAEFKAMLEQVATLKRGSGGRMRGKWELKPEFK